MNNILLFLLGILAAIIAYYILDYLKVRKARAKLILALRTEICRGHIHQLNVELDSHAPEWDNQQFEHDIDRTIHYPTEIYDTYITRLLDLLESEEMAQTIGYYEMIKGINSVKRKSIEPDQMQFEVLRYLRRLSSTLTFAIGTFLLLGGKRTDIATWDFLMSNLRKYGHDIETTAKRSESYLSAYRGLRIAMLPLIGIGLIIMILARLESFRNYLHQVSFVADADIIFATGLTLLILGFLCWLVSVLIRKVFRDIILKG